MVDLAFDTVTLDRCPGCSAIWLEAAELRAPELSYMPGHQIALATPAVQSTDLPVCDCPRHARVALDPYEWRTVTLFRCPRCHGALLSGAAWNTLLVDPEGRGLTNEEPGSRTVVAEALRVLAELAVVVVGKGI
jgi:Zn-finger nucleic acid-binding protein